MVIFYGTAFYGKISTYKEHWVETKFAHLFFIPLFPIQSMVVTDSSFRSRQGWLIETNTKSVIATYARLFTAGLAALMFFWGAASFESNAWVFYLLSLAFAAAWVYFCFFYGKATPEDISMRDKLGSITGRYILPNWLDFSASHTMLDRFMKVYKDRYPEGDWKADLTAGNIEPKKQPILFAIALFNCMLYDSPENDELYYIADRAYVLESEYNDTPVTILQ